MRPSPREVVQLVFEAHGARDTRCLAALMHPDVTATTIRGAHLTGVAEVIAYMEDETDGPRTEIVAHRIEDAGDEVLAFGRARIVDGRSLSDRPAMWRFHLRDGMVDRFVAVCG
jgi:ketosteroid isomerase-like protein